MTDRMEVQLISRRAIAQDVVEFRFARPDGGELPEWSPGAHIDLRLPISDADGQPVIRQYSLCGDVSDRCVYKIAVLCEQAGRGGSKWLHGSLKQGDRIETSLPRNLFPFKGEARCLFIGGGIGITPLIPMIHEARARGLDWQLVYGSRDEDHMAYRDLLCALDPDRVHLHFDARDGLIDLDGLLKDRKAETTVYSCGPTGLLDALESRSAAAEWNLRIERFASGQDVNLEGGSFTVVIASTGQRLEIPSGKSILDVVRAAGIKVDSSCKDGLCGTCETAVLKGLPDHRDSVLTPEEREENTYMMICVSRSLTPELELDL